MRIAYTMSPGRGDTDMVLARLADRLHRNGWNTCGIVQTNTDRGETHPCDMDVRVLPAGPVLRISQSLGPLARGCRLDPSALEHAVALVAGRLDEGADVLIVNKFGKHEAQGRGFRGTIADALARGIPVIAGVNALNLDAFQSFVGGLAVPIDPKVDALASWLGERASHCALTG